LLGFLRHPNLRAEDLRARQKLRASRFAFALQPRDRPEPYALEQRKFAQRIFTKTA